MALLNRAYVGVSGAPGTGSFTLGSAEAGYQSFASAGAVDGAVYSYVAIEGNNWEAGVGTYSSSGGALSRDVVHDGSSGAGVKVNFTSAAKVFCAPLKHDLEKGAALITTSQSFTWVAGRSYRIRGKGGGGGGGEGSSISGPANYHLGGGAGAEWEGLYTPSIGGSYTQTIGAGGAKGQPASNGGQTIIWTPDGTISIHGGRGGVTQVYGDPDPSYPATPGGNTPDVSITPSWRASGIGRRGENAPPVLTVNVSGSWKAFPTSGGGIGAGAHGWSGPSPNSGAGGNAGPPGYATDGAAGFISIEW
ncbi:hypothetical protein [Caulobacter sp. 3R27C2-B]|uniref:hypothetical protein n=1 Tax=Caulobacter sp. 3R27C2-B TaxID=2502219 RepID=UPI0010F81A2E|nr:hypothetical protein [Caulobacter sp. 3R27C2-B]